MRKIILDLAVTLDGFIEGPNGEIDWLAGDENTDFGDILTGILDGIDTIFYGRISYDLWGNYRPEGVVSEKLKKAYDLQHSKKKYVFSTTKTSDDKATVIHSNVKERVLEIKQQPGENIWLYGGASLITTFANLDLIDVYRLSVFPVILGAGKPLFHDIQKRIGLKLRESKSSPSSSVIQLIYDTVAT
jgi:dihydrofolate reductase